MKGIHPAVIIGTPGRMNDHLRKENFNVATVVTLVIDEFDKCLEFGFHDEMVEVIGQLPSLKKRVLLSATDAEEIPQFAGVGGDSPSSVSRFMKLDFLAPEALAPRLRLHKVVLRRRTNWKPSITCFVPSAIIPPWYSAIIVKAWSVLPGT